MSSTTQVPPIIQERILLNNPQEFAEAFSDFVASALVNANNSDAPCPPRLTSDPWTTTLLLTTDVAQILAKTKISYHPEPDSSPTAAFFLDRSDI